jgi:hypothetical protein
VAIAAGAFAQAGAAASAEAASGVSVEPPAASDVEPMRLGLLGGRELVLPASMSDQRVAALICMIEGGGSIVGGGGRL